MDNNSYRKLYSKFNIDPKQMERPTFIQMLITNRQNKLHPNPTKTINKIVLFKGPLRAAFGGMDPNIKVTPQNKSCLNILLKTLGTEVQCAKASLFTVVL